MEPLATDAAPQRIGSSADDPGCRRRRSAAADALVVLVPLAVFVLYAYPLRHWIADDAGISFGYARNLARGFGLVSHPGVPPVEGYSNFAWVLLIAPFHLAGAFSVPLVPKLLSLALVAGSFCYLARILVRVPDCGRLLALGALTLTAMNPAFFIWTTSGLENPLFVFLLAALVARAVAAGGRDTLPAASSVLAAVVATFAALTRPEGVIYYGFYPAAVMAARGGGWKGVARHLALYAAAAAAFYGAFLGFRWITFRDLVPNTYYAKGVPMARTLSDLWTLNRSVVERIEVLAKAIAGKAGNQLLVAAFFLTVHLGARRRLSAGHWILLMAVLWTGVGYLLLPPDWMTEFRFASPFIPLAYAYLLSLTGMLMGGLPYGSRWPRIARAAVVAVLVAGSVTAFAKRTREFREEAPVPSLDLVAEMGQRLEENARRVGLTSVSVLAPDVGGLLCCTDLRVYDLGGLCDGMIARTQRAHTPAYYDYLYGEAQPTFIVVHRAWLGIAALDGDPRFERDYMAVSLDWMTEGDRREFRAGIWVRRDVVGNDPERAALLWP